MTVSEKDRNPLRDGAGHDRPGPPPRPAPIDYARQILRRAGIRPLLVLALALLFAEPQPAAADGRPGEVRAVATASARIVGTAVRVGSARTAAPADPASPAAVVPRERPCDAPPPAAPPSPPERAPCRMIVIDMP